VVSRLLASRSHKHSQTTNALYRIMGEVARNDFYNKIVCDQRESVRQREYQTMPSWCVVAHDGWLCTFIIYNSSWAAPVRTSGTVEKRQAERPIHHVQNSRAPAGILSSSQPGGPPCWIRPLAFDLIVCDSLWTGQERCVCSCS
jgi:hypothetical protein